QCLPASGGPGGTASAARSEEEPARTQDWTQKERREPANRIRYSDRVLQTVRSGPDADSRADDNGVTVIQRSGAGYVAMGDSRAFCFLAGVMPGQRYQRRAGVVER